VRKVTDRWMKWTPIGLCSVGEVSHLLWPLIHPGPLNPVEEGALYAGASAPLSTFAVAPSCLSVLHFLLHLLELVEFLFSPPLQQPSSLPHRSLLVIPSIANHSCIAATSSICLPSRPFAHSKSVSLASAPKQRGHPPPTTTPFKQPRSHTVRCDYIFSTPTQSSSI
jgi:hypothetical protein